MRKIILCGCVFFLMLNCIAKGQNSNFVRLAGNRFVHENGDPFFPMVMNYKLSTVYLNNQFVLSQDAGYRKHGFEIPYNANSWRSHIISDIAYIKEMGFNTIRTGFYPHLNYSVTKKNEEDDTYYEELNELTKNEGWYFPLANPLGQEPIEVFYIDPNDPNDANFQQLLSKYDEILDDIHAAAPELKVIFIMFGQASMQFKEQYWSSAIEYVRRVAEHIALSEYADMVVGFDIVNEPCFHFFLQGPKEQRKVDACNLISSLNDAIKSADNRFLTTIGTCGEFDLKEFDPINMKVDYLSLHQYPQFGLGESRYTPNIQQKLKTTYANRLLWFQRHVSKPWIIGETGFAASNRSDQVDDITLYPQQEVMHGSTSDQEDFLKFLLRESYLAGSAGFSWWEFQDTRHEYSNKIGNYWGVLEMGGTQYPQNGAPSLTLEKQGITNIFRNYVPGKDPLSNEPFNGDLTSDYEPFFNQNISYYNPNNHLGNQYNCPDQFGNTYQLSNIEGYIVNPVTFEYLKDWPVYITTNIGRKFLKDYPPSTPPEEREFADKQSSYVTYTDQTGYFKAIPGNVEDCLPNSFDARYHHNRGIRDINFTMPGGFVTDEFYKWEFDPGFGQQEFLNNFFPELLSTYYHTFPIAEIDSKNKEFENVTFPNSFYVSGENNLVMAEETITIESSTFEPNNSNTSFKAGKEIIFKSEVEVNSGFELDVRTGNIEKTCDGFQWPQQRISESNSLTRIIEKPFEPKSILLQFTPNKEEVEIIIFPQPASDYINYSITTPNIASPGLSFIQITDILGKSVTNILTSELTDKIFVSNLMSGVYMIYFRFQDLSVKTIKFTKL